MPPSLAIVPWYGCFTLATLTIRLTGYMNEVLDWFIRIIWAFLNFWSDISGTVYQKDLKALIKIGKAPEIMKGIFVQQNPLYDLRSSCN